MSSVVVQSLHWVSFYLPNGFLRLWSLHESLWSSESIVLSNITTWYFCLWDASLGSISWKISSHIFSMLYWKLVDEHHSLEANISSKISYSIMFHEQFLTMAQQCAKGRERGLLGVENSCNRHMRDLLFTKTMACAIIKDKEGWRV